MRLVLATFAVATFLTGCASPGDVVTGDTGQINAGSCPVAAVGGVVAAAVGEQGSEASDLFLVGTDLTLSTLTSSGRAFSPVLDRSATRIAYLVNDGTIEADSASLPFQLWAGEVIDGQLSSRPVAQSAGFTSLAISPDGTRAAVVGTSQVVGPDAPRPVIALNEDGTLPAREDSLYLVDLATGRATEVVSGLPDAWVVEVAWTDDGSSLIYLAAQSVDGRTAGHVWRRTVDDDSTAEATLLYVYPDDTAVTVLAPTADGIAVVARGLAAEGVNTTRIELDTGEATPVVGADALFRFSAVAGGALVGVSTGTDEGGSVDVLAVLADGAALRLGTLDVPRVSSAHFLACLTVGEVYN